MPLSIRLLLKAQLLEPGLVRREHLPRFRLGHVPAELVLERRAGPAEDEGPLNRRFLRTDRSSFAKDFSQRCPDRHTNSKPTDDNSSHSTTSQTSSTSDLRS